MVLVRKLRWARSCDSHRGSASESYLRGLQRGFSKNTIKGGVSVCLRLSTFARVCLCLFAFSPLDLLALVSVCLHLFCVCLHLLAPPFVVPPSAWHWSSPGFESLVTSVHRWSYLLPKPSSLIGPHTPLDSLRCDSNRAIGESWPRSLNASNGRFAGTLNLVLVPARGMLSQCFRPPGDMIFLKMSKSSPIGDFPFIKVGICQNGHEKKITPIGDFPSMKIGIRQEGHGQKRLEETWHRTSPTSFQLHTRDME